MQARADQRGAPPVPDGDLGAVLRPTGGVRFTVWAPYASSVEVVVGDLVTPLDPVGAGYHTGVVADAAAGSRYRYRLTREDGVLDHPDPVSRWQPEGVHGPSAVDDPTAFPWSDAAWHPPQQHELVLYELHVGSFTPEGTFDAAAQRLPTLAADGITAIELMPVAQFPGARNWGYDGVLPFAVQDTYGGPDGLRRFVDAAHAAGLAVHLDVVYNHLGPEGNVLDDFGPYFTDDRTTPWGPALNTDGPDSDAVRRFVLDNAVRWVTEFHIDGLRLDAVHGIVDASAVHLLAALAEAVHAAGAASGRRTTVIAESDLQDPRLVRPTERGGYGLDGQWADDLHHVVHTALTAESDGYYADFAGLVDLPAMFRDRFVYAGRYSPYRRRHVGTPAPDLPHDRFVVCIQNHDQVGNRPAGDRLSTLVDLEARKAAAALLLALPFVPLLFMGEEYGERNPFPYFTSHGEPALVEAVRTGRREEFADFASWSGTVPDPQSEDTFASAVLAWEHRHDPQGEHAATLALYRRLLELRRAIPAIADPTGGEPDARHDAGAVVWTRTHATGSVAVVANLGAAPNSFELPGRWRIVCDTASTSFGGPRPDRCGAVVEGGVEVDVSATVILETT